MSNIFTTADELRICAEYKSGKTPMELAARYYCCVETVRLALKRHGVDPRRRRPIAMIMNDWNAGMKSQKLVEKYHFPSLNALHQTAVWYRAHGFRFRMRWNGHEEDEAV